MILLNKLNKGVKCPDCGVDNKCAMENGKSYSACWCMNEPVKDFNREGKVCYCRSCYNKK
jgi:hypothetical protein